MHGGKSEHAYIEAELKQLWCRPDISFKMKGSIYCSAALSVLLYGFETWSLPAKNVCCFEVYDHRCLRYIARTGWSDRMSNGQIKNPVLISEWKIFCLSVWSLRDYVFWVMCCVWRPQFLHLALYPILLKEWKKPCGGQRMMQQCGICKVISDLDKLVLSFLWLGPKLSTNQLTWDFEEYGNELRAVAIVRCHFPSNQKW